MRLGEIKQKIDRVSNASNQIEVNHEPQFGGQAQLVKKYSEIIDVLELFVELKLTDTNQSSLENLISEYPKGNQDELLNQVKFNELNSMVNQLNSKLPIYYTFLETMVPEQEEQVVNIKLPRDINDLKELNEFNKELLDLFKKFNLSGEFKLKGFDKGTSWYEILVTGTALYKYFLACLAVAYSILQLKKIYYESEQAKINYLASLKKDEKFSEDGQKKYSDNIIEVTIREEVKKAIENIKETNGKTPEELATNLVMATKKLIDKLGEGVEFHLSLNPPKYANEEKTGLVIDYAKMPKPIEEKTQKQLKAKYEDETSEK